MTKKALSAAIFCSLFAFPAWGGAAAETANSQTAAPAVSAQAAPEASSQAQVSYDLTFPTAKGVKESLSLDNRQVSYYAYRDLVYVAHPKNADYEKMNIFIPAAYLEGKSVNGYTAQTAPIFLPNQVGGYMPGKAGDPKDTHVMGGGSTSTLLQALDRGYVVASPAIRGRSTTDASGAYVGKAPALIVDYKAAVRYLRHNRKQLPAGDTEKIISNGTSAGGALSALLGATGNSPDYGPYLREIGAAEERDDIFASMDYCPITDLPHADLAYEWVFHGVNTAHQNASLKMPALPASAVPGEIPSGAPALPSAGKAPEGSGAVSDRPLNAPRESTQGTPMTSAQKKVSSQLKALFPAYVNSLGLKDPEGHLLTLDKNGNGSFKEYIKGIYMASAQKALDSGADLSKLDWLTIKDGKIKDMDLAKYAAFATRLKAAPAFDKLDGSSGENDEFATSTNQPRHFSTFGYEHRTDKNPMAPAEEIKLLSPLEYIGKESVTLAPHWRIRHGSVDRDTAMPVPAMLALKLQEQGKDVDFAAAWGKGHAGDYDLNELFAWIDSICK